MVRIDVTRADIEQGLAATCTRCPVALAAARALGRYVEVWPTRLAIYATPLGPLEREIALPPAATNFIRLFDGTGIGCPFSFEIDA